MKKIILLGLLAVAASSCRFNHHKTIKGNGNKISESRRFSDLSRIKVRGGIDVEVQPGSPSMRVEADENLMRYIETREENGWLIVTTSDNTDLKSNHPIRVFLTTDKVRDINIAGSGHVRGLGKFSGADRLNVLVAGSGDVEMAVNTPKVEVDIRGSGTVRLTGETRDAAVEIAGSGDYKASDLLTENTNVAIVGSGDAEVHADNNLTAKLVGSGTVYYRGKANVHTTGAGSGRVKPM